MVFAVLGKVGKQVMSYRRTYRGLVLSFLAVVAAVITIWPLMAAVELAYFTATSSTSAVQLEWATVSEYNLSGFEILCKQLEEPVTAFHRIGFVNALGGPDQGVTYQFNVTTGLAPGQQYCFRLHEVTTNDEPGDSFDLCGYGLAITPVPPAVPLGQSNQELVPLIPAAQTSPTPTAVQVNAVDTPVPLPTIVVATPTVLPEIPTETPTGFAPQSPLIVPSETPVQASVPDTSLLAAAAATPLPTLPPAAETATPELMALVQPTPVPMDTPVPPLADQALAPASLPPAPADTATSEAIAQAQGAPTPVYRVVTATPTATLDRSLAAVPLFTPLPTATSMAPYGDLAQWLAPTSQNLMLMLLCFTFFGASGLGLMGLITSVIFMRARRSRYDDDYTTPTIRRRL